MQGGIRARDFNMDVPVSGKKSTDKVKRRESKYIYSLGFTMEDMSKRILCGAILGDGK